MQEISRRKMLLTAAAGSVGLAASVPAYAAERSSDPDMDSVRNRMMTVEKRGTTLNEEQKYWVLLSSSQPRD